jgi:hypothetical protein
MSKKKNQVRSEAFVFCHGMLGFGEDELINKFMPYWGGLSGSIPKRLRKQGYEAVAPSFGSIGGAWDRACEVYAALTGTRVDYGIAHSKKYGHARYGKTYEKAALPNWGKIADDGEIQRIHLFGHSFGGATVRMLSHLMTYGSEEERAVTDPDDLSPLFAGGKGDWLKTVTAIAGPFDGTTVIDAIGILVPTLKVISFVGFANIMGNTPFRKIYDMQLTQWKITSDRDKRAHPLYIGRLDRVRKFWKSHDDCFWDLCLAGAKELNEFLESNPHAYQFSISTDSSKQKKNGNYKMRASTLFPFIITGNMMGKYDYDRTLGQPLGDEWKASDGCSNTHSALFPSDEPHAFYKDVKDNLQKGVWTAMPVWQGDHMDVVGLSPWALVNPIKYRRYYKNYIKMLMSLD